MDILEKAEFDKRRKKRPFCDHIMEYFHYLVDEYKFQIVMLEEQSSSGFVVYRNSDRGVVLRISFEKVDGYCSLGIGRLKDGKPEKLLTAIDPNGNHVDWEFLDVNESLPVKKNYEKPPKTVYDGTKTGRYMGENATWDYLADHANLLHEFGGSFLQGNQRILPTAKRHLIRRLRRKGWKIPGIFQILKARLLKSS